MDVDLQKKLTKSGYRLFTLPQIDNAVIVDQQLMPSFLRFFSIIVAIIRVYPRLGDFIRVSTHISCNATRFFS